MAARYFVNGGVDNNWGTTGNWSLTSGGAGGEAVPTASDDVTLDTNSPNCTLDTTSRVALTLTATNYTGTMTFDQDLTVSGSITLGSGMTLAGSGQLIAGATGTLTSNGKSVNIILKLQGASTLTLADNWDVSGTLRLGSTTQTTTVNSNSILLSGSLETTGTTGVTTGTTTFVFDGTGTWSNTGGSTYTFRLPTTINTAGTLTVSGTVYYNTGTLTYTAGTVVTTGSLLHNNAAATTFATEGVTWNDLDIRGGVTVTLTNILKCSGTATINSGNNTLTINGSTLESTGSITNAQTSATTQGTTVFLMSGTGTYSSPSLTTGRVSNPLTINTAGTVTFSGSNAFGTGTITHTAGTVTTTSSTLVLRTSITLDTDGITWNNVDMTTGATTVTLSSDWNVSGTFTVGIGNSNMIINGSNLNISGSVSHVGGNGTVTGTTQTNITGTGSWTSTITGSGQWSLDMTINTAGTFTINTMKYDGGTLTFTAGTIVMAQASPLIVSTATTISNAISGLTLGTIVAMTADLTFSGTEGITMAGLIARSQSAETFTFQAGETYTITKAFVVFATGSARCSFVSSSASSDAFINFSGATQVLLYTNLTDINATGDELVSVGGTLTRVTNVVNGDEFVYSTFGPSAKLTIGEGAKVIIN